MGKLQKSLGENEANRRHIHSAGTQSCDFLNLSQTECDNTVRNQGSYYSFNQGLVRTE